MKRAWVVIATLLACAVGPAGAQPQPVPQQARDPFNGQLGSIEIVRPPAEAARLARLMGDALDGLQAQRPGRPDTYVVSVGFWGDAVFENEARQAGEILGDHLGAEGRTITLTAGGHPQRTFPAATPGNLSAAIGHIGSLIDPNEDLVVVFLTSHGANDGSVGIRENNRINSAIRATHLRDMLNAANIRNRVVIVSACFSGAWVAPFADDNTVILTAAQHDRTSFGCQPQREWTFFGDALFAHGVRDRNESLLAAFDSAKVLIERWEREQNLTPPSNPQRYVGARGGELLRQAERSAR
jgi:hypothetical protein